MTQKSEWPSSFLMGAASVTAALMALAPLQPAWAGGDIQVPVSQSHLISSGTTIDEVIVADPDVADVHAHGTGAVSVIGKRPGQTTVRLMAANGKPIDTYTITVGYDLPSIRKSLKSLLPDEVIAVEMVGANIALTGQVSNATVADKAVRIVDEFITGKDQQAKAGESAPKVMNLLQVTSGQQVMLRVRVGEIQREALKELGVDWSNFGSPGSFFYQVGIGAGIERFVTDSAGAFLLESGAASRGVGRVGWSSGGTTVDALVKALERDGLFKLLAEPNLVAVSGEEAEFLAGGEVPIPVPQPGGNGSTVTIEYKPFGVAVKFRPFVLSESRLRMEVQPEVSELDSTNALRISGFSIPAISTRRARTTVELAPGESFMIAGLIKDQVRSNIDNLPGVKELPVLGALFRSTSFQRNETELVIAVTPYVVDPVKSSDVKLPTDNFAPASQMEMFFYGALGTLTGDAQRISQTPSVEGPIGFLVD